MSRYSPRRVRGLGAESARRSRANETLGEFVPQVDLLGIQPNIVAFGLPISDEVRGHIRHLPVQDGDKLIGLVSMRDVMTMMISIKEDRIQRLESTILGAEYQH